jgi:CysZ protein
MVRVLSSRAVGFFRAMSFPFRGVAFVAAHPRLWPWVFAPVAVTVVTVALLLGGAFALGAALLDRWTGGHGAWATVLAIIVLVFVVLALGYVAFVGLMAIVTAPFCALLSERTDEIAGGRALDTGGFVVEAVRGIAHSIAQVAVYGAVVVPLHLSGLLVGPLAPVVAVIGFIATALFLAYDYLDLPLSTRRVRFADKWRFVQAHRAEALGFGGATALLMAIPVVNLFVPPFAAVGATLLHRELAER